MNVRQVAQAKLDRIRTTVTDKAGFLKMAGVDHTIADLVDVIAYALERGDALEAELAELKREGE